jgi:hypothetical protein
MKRRRLVRVVSVAAASLALLGLPGGMVAQGADPELFGYGMGATATSISLLYNQPTFGVPSEPTFELRKVHSEAFLDSGPAGRGLGSVLWPGPVVGNAPPSLAFETLLFNPTQLSQLDEIITRFKEEAAAGTTGSPPYPVRAESSFPPPEGQKPANSFDIGGGVRMASAAAENRVEASSTTGGAGFPLLVRYGSLQSNSFSLVDKGVASAEAVARVSDLDILGVVHVEQILTIAKASSDGEVGAVDGVMQIVGMTITDPRTDEVTAVTYDAEGLKVRDDVHDPLGAAKELIANLAEQGISISLGGPIDLVEGAAASRSITGLTVRLNAKGMTALLDGIPGPVGQAIRTELKNPTGGLLGRIYDDEGGLFSPSVGGLIASFFQGDQDMSFVFGSAAVSSNATGQLPEIELPPPVDIPPVDFGPVGGGDFGGGIISPPGTSNGGGGTRPLAIRPVGAFGIPAGLIALALALALAGAVGLRRLADQVFAARLVPVCPLEDQR